MQHIFAVAALLSAAAAQATSCNANNCLRQVRATAFPSRSISADCSAFQTRTVATSTTTQTIFSLSALPSAPDSVVTRPVPTIPTYASACSSAAAYASACSCIGIPTTVINTVATSTTTTTCSTVKLQATAGPFAGRFITGEKYGQAKLQATNEAEATKFVLENGFLRLAEDSNFAFIAADGQASGLFVYDSTPGPYRYLMCSISPEGAVSCSTAGGSRYFQACADGSDLAFGPQPDRCAVSTPRAIAACS